MTINFGDYFLRDIFFVLYLLQVTHQYFFKENKYLKNECSRKHFTEIFMSKLFSTVQFIFYLGDIRIYYLFCHLVYTCIPLPCLYSIALPVKFLEFNSKV